MNLILHHNDPDGWCGGYLIRQYVKELSEDYTMIECTYGDEFNISLLPFSIAVLKVNSNEYNITAADHIWIVDFSLEKDIMVAINDFTTLIWIDHHPSAIKKVGELDCYGIQTDAQKNYSGCELAWIFLYFLRLQHDLKQTTDFLQDNCPSLYAVIPDQISIKDKVPKYITLIGDYDTWRWAQPDFKRNVNAVERFQYGIRYHHSDKDWFIWDSLANPIYEISTLNQINKNGYLLSHFAEQANKGMVKQRAWKSKKCFSITSNIYADLILMDGPGGSLAWGDLIDEYPGTIFISYTHLGDRFKFSACSKANTNVRKLAEEYGGGGHDLAAGFHNETIPFRFEGKLFE